MDCKTYKNLIRDLVENKLEGQAAERVTSHLVSCPSCEIEFENLFDEKEIYANFLCEIQPPNNLPAQFRAMLEIEELKPKLTDEPAFGFYQWLSKSFAFFRLKTTLTASAILILLALGFVFFSFIDNSKIADNTRLSLAILGDPPLISPQRKETETNTNASVTDSGESKKVKISGLKKEPEKDVAKLISDKQPVTKKVKWKHEIPVEINELNAEEENQFAQIQSLEIDSARQIGKVEMLFRAFRNARSIEQTGQYDVAYEKQQARKLLQNNVKLKQRAESYGTLLTEEMLNKVEPYLLEIANLDNNPSAEQVEKIKDRFRNQSVITELQGF